MALIYDVGMHNGYDTAFYLHQGHSVVAVEANPDFAEAAHKQFCRQIDEGRLTILNLAVGETRGEEDFWVCDDRSEWSSFDRRLASWKGARHHKIRVKVVRFEDILAEFGRPYYLKVDIEGSDHLCLDALAGSEPPPYISVEADEELSTLSLLRACGYKFFKLIRQMNLCPVYEHSVYSQMEIFFRPIRHDPSRRYKFMRALGARWLWSRVDLKSRLERRNRWRFALGSSGPWGDGTPGRWLTFSEAKETYERGRVKCLKDPEGLDFWCDWHAALEANGQISPAS